jgi:hypothetical protein
VPEQRQPDRHRLSNGVVWIAASLSIVHLLNFVNYTTLARYFDPPMTRSILLVSAAFLIVASSARHLGLHMARSWDMYAICGVALLSTLGSGDSGLTLTYAAWLLLAVYVGTELSLRIRNPKDVAVALGIVIVPAAFLVAIANVTLGPVVVHTGRHFGALGSRHIDSAYAMNFICLFFALRAMPNPRIRAPVLLKWSMLATLAWAFYQAVVGLTRSVWLGVTFTLALYVFRAKFNINTLALALFGTLLLTIAISVIGADRLVPDSVKGRVEVTEQRYETGHVDPRIDSILAAFEKIKANPQGTGYAIGDSHNSYVNILLQLGWPGLILALLAIGRSTGMVWRMGFEWFMFFAVGCGALLIHAFFEIQNLPGQANFVPLLTWYAVSRARFLAPTKPQQRPRARFVEP